MHRSKPEFESGFRSRPSYNQELELRDRNRSQNRYQDRQSHSPEQDWQNRSQRYQSHDQNQSYRSHKSLNYNPNRRYQNQRYQSPEQTRRYQNHSYRSSNFIPKWCNQDPRYRNVNGFYDQNENVRDQYHQDQRVGAKLDFSQVEKGNHLSNYILAHVLGLFEIGALFMSC